MPYKLPEGFTEGWGSEGVGGINIPQGSLAYRNNNPGNLRFAGQANASQSEKGFAKFETPDSGYGALEKQVNLDASRGHTLESFINKYAPPSENDTPNYISFLEKETGFKKNDPLSSMDVSKLSQAMAKIESGSALKTASLQENYQLPPGFTEGWEEKPINTSDTIPGLKRGINQTQAMGYGAVGLAGSALGIDPVQKWGFEGYRRNIKEAEQYPKKHTFKDVYTGKAGIGGAVDWAQGTLGELIPFMIETAIGAAIGTAIAPGPGSVSGGLAGRTILKKSIEKIVKKQIEKGIIKTGSKEALEKGVELATKKALKKFGGKVGMAAAVLPLESGDSYASLLSEKGIDAPYTALLAGALKTSIEFVGGNSRLVDAFIDGVGTGSGTIIKRAVKNLLTNIPEEGFQEGSQGLVDILRKVALTDEKLLTVENLEEIIENVGAGAVGGGAGAIVQTALPGKTDINKKTDEGFEPPQTDPDTEHLNTLKTALNSGKATPEQLMELKKDPVNARLIPGIDQILSDYEQDPIAELQEVQRVMGNLEAKKNRTPAQEEKLSGLIQKEEELNNHPDVLAEREAQTEQEKADLERKIGNLEKRTNDKKATAKVAEYKKRLSELSKTEEEKQWEADILQQRADIPKQKAKLEQQAKDLQARLADEKITAELKTDIQNRLSLNQKKIDSLSLFERQQEEIDATDIDELERIEGRRRSVEALEKRQAEIATPEDIQSQEQKLQDIEAERVVAEQAEQERIKQEALQNKPVPETLLQPEPQGQADITQSPIQKGDLVSWKNKSGKVLSGTLIKENKTNLVVKTDKGKNIWVSKKQVVPSKVENVEVEGKPKMVHDHTNTQVQLPNKEAKTVKEFSAKIPDEEIYTEPNNDSYGRETEPHITVKYGLKTNNPGDVKPIVETYPPIKAKMGKVSIFENEKYDVVKVDVDSKELHALNKKIEEEADISLPKGEGFDYTPHATIAYVKSGQGEKYIGDNTFEGKEIVFDEITVSTRDGKQHQIKLEGKQPTTEPQTKDVTPTTQEAVKGEEAGKEPVEPEPTIKYNPAGSDVEKLKLYRDNLVEKHKNKTNPEDTNFPTVNQIRAINDTIYILENDQEAKPKKIAESSIKPETKDIELESEAKKYGSAEEFVESKNSEKYEMFEADRKQWKRLTDFRKGAVVDELGYEPKTLDLYHYGKTDIGRGSYVSTDQYYAESFKEDGDRLFVKKNVPIKDLKAYGEGRIIGRNRLDRKAEGVELIYDPINKTEYESQLTNIWNKANPTSKESLPVEQGKTKTVKKVEKGETKKIEDFGEKIEGAKKFTWARRISDFNLEEIEDKKNLTIDKIFPAPDFGKIAEEQSEDVASLLFYAREEIKKQLRKKNRYRLDYVKSQIKPLVLILQQVGDGTISKETFGKVFAKESSRKIREKIEVIKALGVSNLPHDADKYSIKEFTRNEKFLATGEKVRFGNGAYESEPQRWDDFVVKNGKKVPLTDEEKKNLKKVDKKIISVTKGSTIIKDFKTREEALNWLSKQNFNKTRAKVKLEIFTNRKTKEVEIGKDNGHRKYVIVKGGFKTVKEAREYLNGNRYELEGIYNELKKIPPERRATNEARIGEDYTGGIDVTPEKFGDVFGFRGVQFGNWVEGDRRQKDLNEAFNALHDLANILNVPTQAISLNGELGLAFGARGKGGYSAHYEPGQVVINLTKKKGAGSLAHEWFHAVDNYFGNQLGYKTYITDHPNSYYNTRKTVKVGSEHGLTYGDARKESVDAFKSVVDAINKSELPERSSNLDALRTKDYWSTAIEMAARSFESYIIDRLDAQGVSNDYLANITSFEEYGMDKSFPYPTKEESAIINEVFDKLFSTLETKQTDKGIALFTTTQETKPGKGISLSDIQNQFKNQQVFLAEDDTVSVRFKNGKGIRILSTELMPDGTVKYATESGRMSGKGIILGAAINDTMYLNPDYATTGTISHETWHILTNMGMVTPGERFLFTNEYNKLKRQGKLNFNPSTAVNKELTDAQNKAIQREENEANTFSQILESRKEYRNTKLGKIVQKIVDFLDGIIHIGRQSVRKTARQVESGEIFSREGVKSKEGDPLFQKSSDIDQTKTKAFPKPVLTDEEVSNIMRDLYYGGVVKEDSVKELRQKGVEYIDGYHVFSPAEKGLTKGIETGASWYGKDEAVYFFLDRDDTWKAAPYFALKDEADKGQELSVAHLKIPIDEIVNMEEDGLFNMQFGTYSSVYTNKDIPVQYISQINPIWIPSSEEYKNGQTRYQSSEDFLKEIEESESTFFQKASDMVLGNWKHRKDKGDSSKEDISPIAHIIKSTMYNAEKIGGAYKRLWEVIRQKDDFKKLAQRRLWFEGDESLLEGLKAFEKQDKFGYKKLSNYLKQKDIEAKGFIVKQKQDGWFELLHWKEDKDGNRKHIENYEDENTAWKDAINIEARESGLSPKGQEALVLFRKMSHNLYHHYAKGMQDTINAYEKAGQPIPKITTQTADGTTKIDLYAAMNKMGDLRGHYFPRLRNSGQYRIMGFKSGVAKQMKFFNLELQANSFRTELERKGYRTEIKKVGNISEDLFQNLEPLLAQQQILNAALENIGNKDKIRSLEDMNIKGEWRDNDFVLNGYGIRSDTEGFVRHLGGKYKERWIGNTYKPEIVFEDVAGGTNPDEFEDKISTAILHSGGLEIDMDLAFAQAMVKQYDIVLKGHGARARMISRKESKGLDVIQGYEPDALIALTQAMQAAAGSEAKAIIAKEGMSAIMGRDKGWKDFQAQHTEEAVTKLQTELDKLDLASPEDKIKKEKLTQEIISIRNKLGDVNNPTPDYIIRNQRKIKDLNKQIKDLTKWSDIKAAQELKSKIAQAKQEVYKNYLEMVEDRKIDEKVQGRAYKEATSTLKDILKNEEFADRVVGTLKGLAVWQYLGLRVSSAAVNVTNMGLGVPAAINGETNNKVSLGKALRFVGSGMKNYMLHRAGKLSGEQKRVYDEIQEKGWDDPQLNREAFDVLATKWGKGWQFALEKSMWMFGKTEEMNRAATIAAAYFSMKDSNKGKWKHEEMMMKARDISDKAHGAYGIANRPYQMRGDNLAARTLQLTYVFTTFTHNYLQEMYRLGFDKGQWKAMAYMALAPAIFGVGATVPMGVAKAISSALGGDDPEESLINFSEEMFGGGDIARNGIMGAFDHGVNLRGSLEMRFGLPSTFADLFGAPGSVVSDIWQGGKNITKGYYVEGLEKLAPAAIGNISKGIRETTQGVTTKSGTPIFWGNKPLKSDSIDMIIRMLSFNPTGLSKKKEIQWNEYSKQKKYGEVKSNIYKKLKRFYSQQPNKRNRSDLIKIKADIRDFNIELRDKKLNVLVPYITSKSIKNVLRRTTKAPKRERLRINKE